MMHTHEEINEMQDMLRIAVEAIEKAHSELQDDGHYWAEVPLREALKKIHGNKKEA